MKEIKAILRKERVQAVIAALRAAGVPRMTLSHVHSVGAGVDPEDYRLSMEEGAAYTEKAKLELVCNARDVDRVSRPPRAVPARRDRYRAADAGTDRVDHGSPPAIGGVIVSRS